MARGRYPRRIKAKVPDRASAEKYLIYWKPRDLFFNPKKFPRIDSTHIFGDERPLELEIGCGMGDFLCALAAKNPSVNYIGVDISLRPLHQAVQDAVSRALANIKFIKVDVRLIFPLMPKRSLQNVYVHFPNPNKRKHQRKRRFVDLAFLDHMHSVLAPGGRISVMTDDPEVYADVVAMIRKDGRYQVIPQEDYRLVLDRDLRSHHQRVWEARGKPTLRLELEPILRDAIPDEL